MPPHGVTLQALLQAEVPIPAVLRDYLDECKLRSGRSVGLVFGRTAELPFDPRALGRRAETAWKNAKPKALDRSACTSADTRSPR